MKAADQIERAASSLRGDFSRRTTLLQVKTDGNSEDERLGTPIELQWRITPLLDRIDRRFVEKRLGSKDTDVAEKAVGVDGRFENHGPFILRANYNLWILRTNAMEQGRLFDVSANADRLHRRGRRWRWWRRNRHHRDVITTP